MLGKSFFPLEDDQKMTLMSVITQSLKLVRLYDFNQDS